MAFRGVFIGVDRYQSPHVPWLTGARRDAVALHSLFSDTFGHGAALLVDDKATKSNIEAELTKLAAADPDDVVVIAYSGHGTPSHELVPYDADPAAIALTGIPLAELAGWIQAIPSRRVVCILDCCFSGGYGAKVLLPAALPRAISNPDELLDQMAGEGKLVLTASTGTQPAWEDTRQGHGYLTLYLLEALQGAEEVLVSGKLSVYRLLEYVARRVESAAAGLGEVQRPTLRGSLDGAITWPVFRPGPLYATAFPERVRIRITSNIASLAAYHVPPSMLDAWAGAIPELNQLQLDAVNDFGILVGEHLTVSAPTSSGKTMVGELAAIKHVLERRRAFFLLPMRALVNDKHFEFERKYGAFGLRIIRATGEISDDIPELLAGRYDICLMTYEKFAGLVIGSPHILRQVGCIVVDEVQMIADSSRGANLEFLLTLLRSRRAEGVEPQLIALSAVIGDTNGLEAWLGGRLLKRDQRPVPLVEGVLRWDGSYHYLDADGQEKINPRAVVPEVRKGTSQDLIIPLVRDLISKGQQVLVFRVTKSETIHVANYLALALGLDSARGALDELPTGDPSLASRSLRENLLGGVAFHNADLDRDEKAVIERYFREPDSKIRVIVATTTLAMGVNTPAGAVVIAGLDHPGGIPYSVAEYKNIVGRAGRLGFSEKGFAYVIVLNQMEEHYAWANYVMGKPESLVSRFLDRNTDIRSLAIRVVRAAEEIAGAGLTLPEVVSFLESSFGAFQQQRRSDAWAWDRESVRRAIDDVLRHELLKVDDVGRLSVTDLGRLAGEGVVGVESVVRLVDALRWLAPEDINAAAVITAAQVTVELDEVYLPMNRKAIHKEPAAWFGYLQNSGVPTPAINALAMMTADRMDAAARAKKAAACLMWMTATPLEELEHTLSQFGAWGGNPAGSIRAAASRTRDVLPAVGKVAELLHGIELSAVLAELSVRLEIGLPTELAELGGQVGGRLLRGDYLALAAAGIRCLDEVDARDDNALLSQLGGDGEKLRALRAASARRRSRTPAGGLAKS